MVLRMCLCVCMCVRVCLCLRVTRHYLHLDLHTAVRELLDHALNPYERLHLSESERVDKVRGARAELNCITTTHFTRVTECTGERERVCLYKGDNKC